MRDEHETHAHAAPRRLRVASAAAGEAARVRLDLRVSSGRRALDVHMRVGLCVSLANLTDYFRPRAEINFDRNLLLLHESTPHHTLSQDAPTPPPRKKAKDQI